VSRARSLGLAIILPLYLAIATALGFVDYRVRTDPDAATRLVEYSRGVVTGTEAPPGRYRVLAPYAWEWLERFTGLESRESWILFRWLCLVGALIAGHVYLRTWFDEAGAVLGSLVMAALVPLTFTNGWAHPDHLMELFLFTLGCACIARGWLWALVPVLALNGLNRETSAFLVLLFFFSAPASRSHLAWTIGLGSLWAVVYVGLRAWKGWASYDWWQLGENWARLTPLPPVWDPYKRAFAWFVAILVVPLLLLIFGATGARAWRQQPRFMRAAAAVVPVFLGVSFLFSSINETRIFTPLIPLLLPGAVFALTSRHDATS
jgi:hypothetical protein